MYNVHAKTFVTRGFNRKPEVQNLDCKSLSEMYLLQSCIFKHLKRVFWPFIGQAFHDVTKTVSFVKI